MADEVLEIRKMTINEVKENPPKIEKKFLLINSSLYTDEAFEYILELVNETDSVLFIRNTRQIYTHGEYFGGDIWEDRLFYFSTYQLLNDADEIITDIKSEVANETLRIKGMNNIILSAEEEYIHGTKIRTLNISYDLENAVDTSEFDISDPSAKYNLQVEDGKIKINKYIPIRVELENVDNSLFEYDKYPEVLNIPIHVYGTSDTKNISVVLDNNTTGVVSEDLSSISIPINSNNAINCLILYDDGRSQGSIMYKKNFGYGIFYSNEEITESNAYKLNTKYLASTNIEGDFILNQNENEYGYFACPSQRNPIFIDESSGIGGGWKKISNFNLYSTRINYSVYRTEQSGLGRNKWIIKEY